MRILFWNLKGNSNEGLLSKLLQENAVDIAIFAEYQGTSFNKVSEALDQEYVQYDGYGACEKITLVCKKAISTTVKREQNRYTLYSCLIDNRTYNIVGIHLPAPPYADSNDRKSVIRDLVQDICEQERMLKNRRTIVIGDFNCNPFDEELLQKDAFNAVLFKSIINYQETIRYNEKERRRFYNHAINYISEETKTYGSLYYSSGSAPIYWNSFDQILVRKELMDNITGFMYLRMINGKHLLKDIKPDSTISDHLPLLVNITKG